MDWEKTLQAAKQVLNSSDLLTADETTDLREAIQAAEAIPEGPDRQSSAQLRHVNELTEKFLSRTPIKRRTGFISSILVMLSLILMYIVATTSLFYYEGAALLSDLERMSSMKPARVYGQLERQLQSAQKEIFARQNVDGIRQTAIQADATGGSQQKIDALATESTYVILHELIELNTSIEDVERRYMEYQSKSGNPIVRSLPNFLLDYFGQGRIETQAASERQNSTTPDVKYYCGFGSDNESESAKFYVPKGREYALGMSVSEMLEQACKYNLSNIFLTIPNVDRWAFYIRSAIAPYGAWILPSLYAALGAFIFYLRQTLDENQANPKIGVVVLRVALAGLAGIIVGWFWQPGIGTDKAVQSAGIGLFTVAFIIGFSIEIFFNLLNRLVSVTQSAIDALGKPANS